MKYVDCPIGPKVWWLDVDCASERAIEDIGGIELFMLLVRQHTAPLN